MSILKFLKQRTVDAIVADAHKAFDKLETAIVRLKVFVADELHEAAERLHGAADGHEASGARLFAMAREARAEAAKAVDHAAKFVGRS